MTLRYAHTVARFIDRPLLVLPRHAMAMWNALSPRFGLMGGDLPSDPAAELIDKRFKTVSTKGGHKMSRLVGDFVLAEDGRSVQPFKMTGDGIAILSVVGELVNRGAWVGSNSGLVSYEGLKLQLDALRTDSRVKSVIIDVDSPGGEAVGFELAAGAVRALAAEKTTVAVVNGMAASAAYALISGASEIVTPATGISGSIGVVMLHLDLSRALDKEGITPTLIFTGDHKVDANPFEPLPENVRQDLQAEADAFYDAFINVVAQGRQGRTTAKDARATQARTFIGSAAIDAGLVDQIGSFEDVLAALSRRTSRRDTMTQGTTSFSLQTQEPGDGIPIIEFGGEQFADVSALAAQQRALGRAQLTARINEVLADERTQGRERFAVALACENPDMAVERVLELTAMSGREIAAAPATPSIEQRAKETGAEAVSSLPIEPEGENPTPKSWAKVTDALNARLP